MKGSVSLELPVKENTYKTHKENRISRRDYINQAWQEKVLSFQRCHWGEYLGTTSFLLCTPIFKCVGSQWLKIVGTDIELVGKEIQTKGNTVSFNTESQTEKSLWNESRQPLLGTAGNQYATIQYKYSSGGKKYLGTFPRGWEVIWDEIGNQCNKGHKKMVAQRPIAQSPGMLGWCEDKRENRYHG